MHSHKLPRDLATKKGPLWRCYNARKTSTKADQTHSTQRRCTCWNTTNQRNSEQEEKTANCPTTRFAQESLEEFLQKAVNLSAWATATYSTTGEYPLPTQFTFVQMLQLFFYFLLVHFTSLSYFFTHSVFLFCVLISLHMFVLCIVYFVWCAVVI